MTSGGGIYDLLGEKELLHQISIIMKESMRQPVMKMENGIK